MIFSIFVIVFVGIIAFYHFVQGFFSAAISAALCVLAAVMAVSYHEPLAKLLLKGKMADQASSLCLVLIFAVVYIVCRLIFDKAVPGNVRTPATVDKVGAGLMGLVAGVFAVGIFTIAVEMLPFNPSIQFMGYSRYELLDDRAVVTPPVRATNTNAGDSFVYKQMKADKMADEDQTGRLWLPVDDWVLGVVYHLSNGGSLAGDRTLASIHPDYLQELWGERAGIQTGTRHVALQYAGNDSVSFGGAYQIVDPIPANIGTPRTSKKNASDSAQLMPAGYHSWIGDHIKPIGGLVPVVVRIKLGSNSTDDLDHLFRFSPASVRLVEARPDASPDQPPKDFYMVGTMDGSKHAFTSRPDDFLFVNVGNGDAGFDAIFMVDKSILVGRRRGQGQVRRGDVHRRQAAGQDRPRRQAGRHVAAGRRRRQAPLAGSSDRADDRLRRPREHRQGREGREEEVGGPRPDRTVRPGRASGPAGVVSPACPVRCGPQFFNLFGRQIRY